MKYEWLDDYCLSMKGAVKEFKVEWNATRFMVGDKMFLLQGGDKQGNPLLTVKLEPLHGELLRKQFADIIPGYYMNKEHWNSVQVNGNVPDEVVKDMLARSYQLVLRALPKKKQAEIIGD